MTLTSGARSPDPSLQGRLERTAPHDRRVWKFHDGVMRRIFCGNRFPIAERNHLGVATGSSFLICRYWILISSTSNTSIPNGACLP